MKTSDLFDEESVEMIREEKKRLDKARKIAECQIDIEYPWNYDPSSHQIHQDGFKPALRWTIESRLELQDASNNELRKLAARMEAAEKAFVEEFDREDEEMMYYKSIFLTISIQDGLISWLCEHGPNLSGSDPNNVGEEVSWGMKRKAL